MPRLAYSGLELAVGERPVGHRVGQLFIIGLAAVECEQPRIVLFDNADVDAADCRQALAFHLGDNRAVGGIGAFGKNHFAKIRIGFQQDLVRALPVLEHIRAGADRIAHRPAVTLLAILFDHLAGDSRHRRLRHVVHQHVIGVLELEPYRVAIDRLHAFDLCVVVQLAGLFRLFDDRVGAHELVLDIEQVRRAHPGIEQPLPRVDVVVGDQLPLPAVECRIVGKENPLPDPYGPGQPVVGDFRQRGRGIGHQLVGPRQIVVAVERIENVAIDEIRIQIADCLRIEAGLGDLERHAQRLVHVGRVAGAHSHQPARHRRHGQPARAPDAAKQPGQQGPGLTTAFRWHRPAPLVRSAAHSAPPHYPPDRPGTW